jgi:AraC-like DNA-binding protein
VTLQGTDDSFPGVMPKSRDKHCIARLIDSALRRPVVGRVFLSHEKARHCLTALDCPRFSLCLRGEARYHVWQNGVQTEMQLRRGDVIHASAGCMMEPAPEANYLSLGVVPHAHLTRFLIAQKRWFNTATPSAAPVAHVARHEFLVSHHTPKTLDADGRHLCEAIDHCAGRPPTDRWLQALFRALLIRCHELLIADDAPHTSEEGRSHFRWQAACQFIRDHLHEPLGRDSIAAFLQLHPNHISRLFTRFSETTFNQYVMNERIQRARRLLTKDPGLNLADIAAACGFSDPNYFSRCYRKVIGRAPRTDRS